MRSDKKLNVVVVGQQIVQQNKKAKLPLGGQCSLGFVHDIESGTGETVLQQREKRFSMGLGMETFSSVAVKYTHGINVTRYVEKALRSQVETLTRSNCEPYSYCAIDRTLGVDSNEIFRFPPSRPKP